MRRTARRSILAYAVISLALAAKARAFTFHSPAFASPNPVTIRQIPENPFLTVSFVKHCV